MSKHNAISKNTLSKIEDLLDSGVSIAKIGKQFGLNKYAVGLIKDGIHPMQKNGHSIEKCEKCGYTVQMPCLICKSRLYRKKNRLFDFDGSYCS